MNQNIEALSELKKGDSVQVVFPKVAGKRNKVQTMIFDESFGRDGNLLIGLVTEGHDNWITRYIIPEDKVKINPDSKNVKIAVTGTYECFEMDSISPSRSDYGEYSPLLKTPTED
jgi:hypothetical protein